MLSNIALYPGSFDPVTYGHIDIIERGSKLFKKLVVAVAQNTDKNELLSVDERVQLLTKIVKSYKNVFVDTIDGLLVEYLKQKRIRVVLRGIRTLSDFEYEFQMALANRAMHSDIETIFIMTSEKCSHISAKLVREIALFRGKISSFVPPVVESFLQRKGLVK
jgi:pantetheine-phosphate adenylyltransferase